MSLFQKSVEKKYLNELDSALIDQKYKAFQAYFANSEIQENIRNAKEEQFQEGFLRELFVSIFGYTLNPQPNFNLTTELKNIANSKKADGAILRNDNALAVIELKGTDTTDLDSIESQAFGYKNHHPKCDYVITSNFEKLRFYIQNAVDHIDFDLFNLTREQFSLMWLCLSKNNLMSDLPLKIKESSVLQEENITKKFYADYSKFREDIYNNLIENNTKNSNGLQPINNNEGLQNNGLQPIVNGIGSNHPIVNGIGSNHPIVNGIGSNHHIITGVGSNRPPVVDKLTLFKKTQKLLDRFLFIFFAEDRLLLPPNSISEIVKQWKTLKDELDEYVPLYDRFKKYFGYMNTGYKGTKYDIYAYNGGLFAPDEILDNISIDDDILLKHTLALSQYNYETDVDVNILGHIFEHSLGEIESVKAAMLENKALLPIAQSTSVSKRKKDGIFYTPKYITKYIVENTVGKLCEEKRKDLDIVDEEYAKGRKNRKKDTIKTLDDKLTEYRNWLLSLTILDPACGSGAFLNQALDFLITEHRKIDNLRAQLFGGGIVFSDITTDILEKNIYGVDLNEESVEIAKLSLWLHTAQKGRKLNKLNNNIKCGNSLIDNPEFAGEKTFNWQKEFPDIFRKKEKKAWHITWVTHDTRTSERMIKYKVRERRATGEMHIDRSVYLDNNDALKVTEIISSIVVEDKYNCLAYNIFVDHIHILLVCEEEELPNIVRKLKGKSAQKFKEHLGISKDETYHLWAQKFDQKLIESHQQLNNTIEYIKNNREKHLKTLHQQGIIAPCSNKSTATLYSEQQEIATPSPEQLGAMPFPEHPPCSREADTTPSSDDQTAPPCPNQEQGVATPYPNQEQGVATPCYEKEIATPCYEEGIATPCCEKEIATPCYEEEQHFTSSIQPLIQKMTCTYDHAFRTEYKGGFDVVIGNPPYVHLEKIKETSIALKNANYETYHSQGDIYCVFVEKGIDLLKPKGIISYIMPNKWLQAGYGKPLREYFLKHKMFELIDFGDIQIFDGATTYPCIFSSQKAEPGKEISISVLKESRSMDFKFNVRETAEVFETNSFSGETWVISSQKEQVFLDKLKAKFATLSDFIGGQSYRGVLTGLTEAFLIDEETKQTIIKKDANAAEIIKPFLQGRDLTKYNTVIPNSYLILFEKGSTNKKITNKTEVENWLPLNYHSVYNWLKPFEERGKKRADKGDYWWELRACDYYQKFAQPKIMYQAFQVKPCFIYDEQGLFCNNSIWFIPTENKALLGVLNSKMGWWLITKYCTQIQNGYQLIWKYFGQIPVPKLDSTDLNVLVDRMLSLTKNQQAVANNFVKYLKSQVPIEKIGQKLENWFHLEFSEFIKELNNTVKKSQEGKLSKSEDMEWMELFENKKSEVQTIKLEIETVNKEIDRLAYKLYGLSEEEVKIVEENA